MGEMQSQISLRTNVSEPSSTLVLVILSSVYPINNAINVAISKIKKKRRAKDMLTFTFHIYICHSGLLECLHLKIKTSTKCSNIARESN